MALQNIPIQMTEWGLSSQAMIILSREPELLLDLAEKRLLPPLPPGYIPSLIEVLFDDVPYIRSLNGELTYTRVCLPNYQPQFIEYRFDNEIAVFQVGDEFVVNRIEGIAQIASLQRLSGGHSSWF